MKEFNQQLGAVESEMTGTAREYPDMDPEARRECQDRLDQTVKTLLKIQKDLVKADKVDPDAKVLLVVQTRPGWEVTACDFVHSFARARISGINPAGIELFKEKNYMLDESGKVLSGAVDEWYIRFGSEKEARNALGLQRFEICLSGSGYIVNFGKPVQTFAVRATFRKIGALVERIREIEKELLKMGAVYDCGKYTPDRNKYINKADFTQIMTHVKRIRDAGLSLHHQAYAPLKHRKLVDTAVFMARTKKLYNEECDCLITLREFQFNGVEFDF